MPYSCICEGLLINLVLEEHNNKSLKMKVNKIEPIGNMLDLELNVLNGEFLCDSQKPRAIIRPWFTMTSHLNMHRVESIEFLIMRNTYLNTNTNKK